LNVISGGLQEAAAQGFDDVLGNKVKHDNVNIMH